MRFAALFLWVTLPMAAWGIYGLLGLPHSIWEYEFTTTGDVYDPFADRTYISCTFWGPYGRFKMPADGGNCPWVRFFKAGADQ